MAASPKTRARLASFLLGIGLGGFVDGIVLHQLVQWHNMLSSVLPPTSMEAMRTNMTWDGVFHAFVWVVTLAGVLLLRAAGAAGEAIPSTRAFAGLLLLGWGVFNLVEGVVDHQLLGLHDVREVADPTPYNLAFLAVGGVAFTALGWILSRADRSDQAGPRSRPAIT